MKYFARLETKLWNQGRNLIQEREIKFPFILFLCVPSVCCQKNKMYEPSVNYLSFQTLKCGEGLSIFTRNNSVENVLLWNLQYLINKLANVRNAFVAMTRRSAPEGEGALALWGNPNVVFSNFLFCNNVITTGSPGTWHLHHS